MIVGLPREVQDHEYRTALTPAGAKELIEAGAQALVEAGVGAGSGFADDAYPQAGAPLSGVPSPGWRGGGLGA